MTDQDQHQQPHTRHRYGKVFKAGRGEKKYAVIMKSQSPTQEPIFVQPEQMYPDRKAIFYMQDEEYIDSENNSEAYSVITNPKDILDPTIYYNEDDEPRKAVKVLFSPVNGVLLFGPQGHHHDHILDVYKEQLERKYPDSWKEKFGDLSDYEHIRIDHDEKKVFLYTYNGTYDGKNLDLPSAIRYKEGEVNHNIDARLLMARMLAPYAPGYKWKLQDKTNSYEPPPAPKGSLKNSRMFGKQTIKNFPTDMRYFLDRSVEPVTQPQQRLISPPRIPQTNLSSIIQTHFPNDEWRDEDQIETTKNIFGREIKPSELLSAYIPDDLPPGVHIGYDRTISSEDHRKMYTFMHLLDDHGNILQCVDQRGRSNSIYDRLIGKDRLGHTFAIQKKLDIPIPLQASGLAKKLYRQNFDAYKKWGIDNVFVHADMETGGAAWAKAGFDFANVESQSRWQFVQKFKTDSENTLSSVLGEVVDKIPHDPIMERKIDKLWDRAEEFLADLEARTEYDEPRPLELVNIKLGDWLGLNVSSRIDTFSKIKQPFIDCWAKEMIAQEKYGPKYQGITKWVADGKPIEEFPIGKDLMLNTDWQGSFTWQRWQQDALDQFLSVPKTKTVMMSSEPNTARDTSLQNIRNLLNAPGVGYKEHHNVVPGPLIRATRLLDGIYGQIDTQANFRILVEKQKQHMSQYQNIARKNLEHEATVRGQPISEFAFSRKITTGGDAHDGVGHWLAASFAYKHPSDPLNSILYNRTIPHAFKTMEEQPSNTATKLINYHTMCYLLDSVGLKFTDSISPDDMNMIVKTTFNDDADDTLFDFQDSEVKNGKANEAFERYYKIDTYSRLLGVLGLEKDLPIDWKRIHIKTKLDLSRWLHRKYPMYQQDPYIIDKLCKRYAAATATSSRDTISYNALSSLIQYGRVVSTAYTPPLTHLRDAFSDTSAPVTQQPRQQQRLTEPNRPSEEAVAEETVPEGTLENVPENFTNRIAYADAIKQFPHNEWGNRYEKENVRRILRNRQLTPAEVYAIFIPPEKLSEGGKIKGRLDITEHKIRFNAAIEYPDHGRPGLYDRVVTADYAYQALLSLPSTKRGGRTSKIIYKNNFEQYQKIGIPEVRIHAAKSGGAYSWAKAGFDWDSESSRNYSTSVANEIAEKTDDYFSDCIPHNNSLPHNKIRKKVIKFYTDGDQRPYDLATMKFRDIFDFEQFMKEKEMDEEERKEFLSSFTRNWITHATRHRAYQSTNEGIITPYRGLESWLAAGKPIKDFPIGHDLMMGEDWEGIFSLDNPQQWQLDALKEYVGAPLDWGIQSGGEREINSGYDQENNYRYVNDEEEEEEEEKEKEEKQRKETIQGQRQMILSLRPTPPDRTGLPAYIEASELTEAERRYENVVSPVNLLNGNQPKYVREQFMYEAARRIHFYSQPTYLPDPNYNWGNEYRAIQDHPFPTQAEWWAARRKKTAQRKKRQARIADIRRRSNTSEETQLEKEVRAYEKYRQQERSRHFWTDTSPSFIPFDEWQKNRRKTIKQGNREIATAQKRVMERKQNKPIPFPAKGK